MDKLATVVNIFGYEISLMNLAILVALFGVLYLFYRIQKTEKLDFADMITKNGRAVSLTKVLQLIGGVTATWVVIKFTLVNQLNEGIFGLYLAYVAGVEGYSKFVAAKYKYEEQSVRDGQYGRFGSTQPGSQSQSQPEPEEVDDAAAARAARKLNESLDEEK